VRIFPEVQIGMEAAALFVLTGLGYVVTQLSGKPKDTESFQSGIRFPTFNTLMATEPPPSEPNPEELQGEYINAVFSDAKITPNPIPAAPNNTIETVMMNQGGVEETPSYGTVTTDEQGRRIMKDATYSELMGMTVKTSDFTHNNMVPFFGGSVKQNVDFDKNTGILDNLVGAGTLQIKKQEVETMFDSARAPYGNPFGMEASADFVKSRMNNPRSRAGEKPFEPTRVGPAVNEGFGTTGKGGFQQIEVNEYMMGAIRKTDDLRTADNPKLTYAQPVVPGQHFIGGAAESPGEVRKYRPDKFYIDEHGERLLVTTGDVIKGATRPVQVMKHVTRPETSVENFGTAGAQDAGQSYVTGSYHIPMTQQYGGAGFRNADMTSYYTNDVNSPESDYGRSSIEIRPNERNLTGERTMGLNLVPADTGNVTVHFNDDARPTRREEMSGNIRQTGTPVGFAGGAPAVTVWDPNDVARTTVKEGTIDWNYMGIASSADGPTKLKVYDPDDIAKPTQKSQISAKSDYFGTPNSVNKDFTSHDSAYNMRLNPNKQQIAKGRNPMHGNGGALAIFDGQIKQTTRRVDADSVNDRADSINRVVGIPTGVGDIGQVRYKVPLQQDVNVIRNQREILAGIHSNPLFDTQDLSRNAEHDEAMYASVLQSM
jgi:hypothetical protein